MESGDEVSPSIIQAHPGLLVKMPTALKHTVYVYQSLTLSRYWYEKQLIARLIARPFGEL